MVCTTEFLGTMSRVAYQRRHRPARRRRFLVARVPPHGGACVSCCCPGPGAEGETRVKTFKFLLKNHKLNLLLGIILLFIQANCDLMLPTLMSDIVDTGISGGGIDSVVPDTITQERLDQVDLFLTDDEASLVDAAYTEDGDVLVFSGTDEDREELEGFMGEAETLIYQIDEGISTDELTDSLEISAESTASLDAETQLALSQLMEQIGDTIEMDYITLLMDAGLITTDDLVSAREAMVDELGDNAELIVESRGIEFVKTAYEEAGVDLDEVQTDYLFEVGGQMLIYALIVSLCAITEAFNATKTAAAVARDLRHDVYKRVLSFSPAEMNEFSAASLITRCTNDIQQIQQVLVMCMRIVLLSPCMAVVAIGKVLSFGHTGLEWIIIVAILALCIVIGVLMGLTMPKFRIMQDLVDKNNLIAREILTGIMPIRAFGRSDYEEKRYDEANRELTDANLFTNRVMSFMMPLMLIIMNLISILIIWFGAQAVDTGTMQVGDLMAYINYSIQVIMSFMIITAIAVMLPRADVASERIQEVLRTDSSIKDPAELPAGGARPELATAGEDAARGAQESPWRGQIAFNDVSFTYPDAELPTIEHISFTVEPGQTFGIIGSTGVGKSTLIQLIPRLYDVTEGSITIDGVDVRTVGLEELRDLIGYVPQKGMLFSGTIESNIKYGDPSMPDEQMVEAAETAQATEFIDAKSEGYQSPIAQGGSNVSGGQKQRLCIARALAIDPKILIFDDSFSALDYQTDANLREALAARGDRSSVIIVGQRIATIMHADQILVLDDGRAVGLGTHEELLRTCPEYLEIATSQLSAEELGLGELGIEMPSATGAAAAEGGER